jgi:hypothetical protein
MVLELGWTHFKIGQMRERDISFGNGWMS